jgi:hypothetical protein
MVLQLQQMTVAVTVLQAELRAKDHTAAELRRSIRLQVEPKKN